MSDPEPGHYVGRFAPSPTGPLHFGSLVAAVASYLDARAADGLWLVRMEDIDPPRETPEAASDILRGLEHFGLHWDGSVLYQSSRLDSYSEALAQLTSRELTFPCTCRRTPPGAAYDGRCRGRSMNDLPREPYAVRVRIAQPEILFEDLLQGEQRYRLDLDPGDFVIKRKDGYFAYQLAVAVDDAWQGITRVVRGIDLLESTARQIYLQQQLGYATPEYAHFPVITDADGNKLSKQAGARPLAERDPARYVAAAFAALGLAPPEELVSAPVAELLAWGTVAWSLGNIPATGAIPETEVSYLPSEW